MIGASPAEATGLSRLPVASRGRVAGAERREGRLALRVPPLQPARLGIMMLWLRQSSLKPGDSRAPVLGDLGSWLVGVGVTVVRIGEVGALLAGIAAVVAGGTAPRPSRNVGLWCGTAALVLVIGLNLLGLLIR